MRVTDAPAFFMGGRGGEARFRISKSHLTKVVFQPGQAGLVGTVRGRNGGMRGEPGEHLLTFLRPAASPAA